MALKYGDIGEGVKNLQSLLTALRFFKGTIGGHFLTKTRAALCAFQKAHRLKVDGSFGPESSSKMAQLFGPVDRCSSEDCVQFVRRLVGIAKYVLGGNGETVNGVTRVDCSGLIVYALRAKGIKSKGFDTTANGFKGMCEEIHAVEKPFDLIFNCDKKTGHAKHVMIFSGDERGDIIHAYNGVECSFMQEIKKRFAKKYDIKFGRLPFWG